MLIHVSFIFFFFFQAEDGIRDVAVTGVQTCALPIWLAARNVSWPHEGAKPETGRRARPLFHIARAPPRSPRWPRSRWTCSSSAAGSRAPGSRATPRFARSEEHTSELQSRLHLVCRLLLEKKK